MMALMEEGEEILAMYDVYAEFYSGNNYLGMLYGLDSDLEFVIDMSGKELEPAEGYTRAYGVIRGHEDYEGNKTAKRVVFELDGENL
jgi:hypothetical protein